MLFLLITIKVGGNLVVSRWKQLATLTTAVCLFLSMPPTNLHLSDLLQFIQSFLSLVLLVLAQALRGRIQQEWSPPVFVIAVQSLSCVWFFVTPWTAAFQAPLSHYLNLLKFLSIELVMLSNSLILCHLLPLLPSIFQHQGVFAKNQLFISGGQSIRVSVSARVLPMNIQGWFPLGLTSLISLQSKGLSRVFSRTTIQNHQFFNTQPSLCSNSHISTWLLEKLGLDRPLLAKWCLCFLICCLGLS